jgi:DNA-binding beta-propeller fold protein YncE
VAAPDGKTVYVLDSPRGTVTPISTATGQAGKPIFVGLNRLSGDGYMAITPDGKTLYVTKRSAIAPINTATDQVGPPIPVHAAPVAMAFSPDGKTAYAVSEPTGRKQVGAVTPINTVTNRASQPILIKEGYAFDIVITPDGKTAYIDSGSAVTPVSTATDKAGRPIHLAGNLGSGAMVITPDGKTIYLLTGAHSVLPISTVTYQPGTPIRFGSGCPTPGYIFSWVGMALTPDGKTLYVACAGGVVPISTTTNVPGRAIPLPAKEPDGIAISAGNRSGGTARTTGR